MSQAGEIEGDTLIVCIYVPILFCMLVQGTAEKQLLLMLSPCLNNKQKKKKKTALVSSPRPFLKHAYHTKIT